MEIVSVLIRYSTLTTSLSFKSKSLECICKQTEKLAPGGVDFQFRTSYDGSAKGAAFIAATSK